MEPSVGILKQEIGEDISLTDHREITDPVAVLRMCVGLAWEDFLIPQLQDVVDHPGEILYDGVYMSPDGEELSIFLHDAGFLHRLYVIEVKCTWKSMNTVGDLTDEKKNFMWLAQIRSYCKANSTRHAKLYVLFVCGDYSFPITPQLVKFTLEFTQLELDDSWDFLLDYKREKMGENSDT